MICSAFSAELPSILDTALCGRNNAVDAGLDAVNFPGPRGRNGTGLEGPKQENKSENFFIACDSLRDQLLAIRRRLWIVNATLEFLPANIEETLRQRSAIAVAMSPTNKAKTPKELSIKLQHSRAISLPPAGGPDGSSPD